MTDEVLLNADDGVATLVLNRPDNGNTIDLALAHRLFEAA